MKRSIDRILTTHTGSLPRHGEIVDLLVAREEGNAIDSERFAELGSQAVVDVVEKQVAAGLDVVNDGEQTKPSYATYLIDRVSGYGPKRRKTFPRLRDVADFPDWARTTARGLSALRMPVCTGPLSWIDFEAVDRDLARLSKAVAGKGVEEAFLTAASPGLVSNMLPNEFYPTEDEYLDAVAEVMQKEYEAVVDAGFLLQIDCPDLAMGHNAEYAHLSLEEFKKVSEQHVEVLNHALRNIDPDRLRMHVCWGNYEGPHNHDVPLEEIAPIILKARPNALCLEGSNPRHAHEWKVWREVPLPDDKVIVTGCIDSTSNFVEHPDLVSDRICRYADVLGRERVIAGTDCGFGTLVGHVNVEAHVAWAKLESLAHGAEIASKKLW